MQSNVSFESLSTAYFTASESHISPPLPRSLYGTPGPSFHANYNRGNIINVAGDVHYNITVNNAPTVTYPPDRANHAPTGAITRHFVGRTNELLQIHCAFDFPREVNRPVQYALCGAAGIGKSQLALQYAECAYTQRRYSHVFHISAASTGHIRKGLAHMLRLVQPSDYVCAKSTEAHEARRWLEDAHSDIVWLLIVDSAVLDSVNYLRTHLPRKSMAGDILFVSQSEAVANALADEGHGTVLEVGPLDLDDAVQLLLKKATVEDGAEFLEEARSIVERLDRLPIPIHQAASFARYHQGNLRCLTRLLQEGRGTVLSRWDTRLTGYDYTTFENMVQAQFSRLASDRPQAAELLKVLCYLHPRGISLPILLDGARLLHSSPTKASKVSQFMGRLALPPWDLYHPLRALLSAIASQDELYNLVRCLQHISLVRLETVHLTNVASNADPLKGQSYHFLRIPIPDLVGKIVRGGKEQMAEESAYYDMAVRIIASAFVQRKHDPTPWRPFLRHIPSLCDWELKLIMQDQRRLYGTSAALRFAINILADFDRKVETDNKLEIDSTDELRHDRKLNLRDLNMRATFVNSGIFSTRIIAPLYSPAPKADRS
ncbi:hypothetical protein FIBSPDRAFT_926218 [Athelia psychrophila]|uniref:NB-ARC domain-containing protein n=1 Tax=Athelia psychrophila TaxID=1759441 RepID=A0A166TLW1_9AGAM|nr:hypothetical protein FIBSPDRAFT_926218 [Fibularhizoctonia sp. CBS 109695]